MFLWIKQARAVGTPISGALILAEKLSIRDFKANLRVAVSLQDPMILDLQDDLWGIS